MGARRPLATERSTSATRSPRVLLVGRGTEPFALASSARKCRSATSRSRDATHRTLRRVAATVTIDRRCFSLHANQARLPAGIYSSISLIARLFVHVYRFREWVNEPTTALALAQRVPCPRKLC